MDAVSATALKADKWQRLSPTAIVYYIVKFVGALIKQGFQGLAPVAAIAFAAGENRWLIIGALAALAGAGLLAAAFLSYLKFRYRIDNQSFLIQSGVLTRKRLSLAFDRIQNVAIKEPLYFRPFGMVILVIESAGSSGSEVSLAGIPRALADNIRTTVLAQKEAHPAQSAGEELSEETTEKTNQNNPEILRQPISELVRYGLTNNNVWVFAGILAGATAQFDWWEHIPVINVSSLSDEYGTGSYFLIALAGLGSFSAFIAAMMAASAVGAIFVYYDYRLSYQKDGRFLRTKGLFEKQETSLKVQKIQSLTIKQPWPARIMSRYNLTLNQVGFQGVSNDGKNHASTKFIVPSVKHGFVKKISQRLYPDLTWSRDTLSRISRRYSLKTVFYEFLPVSLIPAISLAYNFGPIGLIPLLIPLVSYPVVERYRKMFGYMSDGEHGFIQTGFIGTRCTVLPFYKAQTVELVRSPGQRKHDLATLHINMAGTKHTIPYLPLNDALQWRDDILRHIESSKKAWM